MFVLWLIDCSSLVSQVVQVPVSTAIYFVESEIPSIVEKSSSVIHPWDLPGIFTSDLLASDQLSTFSLWEPDMD